MVRFTKPRRALDTLKCSRKGVRLTSVLSGRRESSKMPDLSFPKIALAAFAVGVSGLAGGINVTNFMPILLLNFDGGLPENDAGG